MQTEATDFTLQVCPLVCKPNQHPDFIIIVDQTPVHFALKQGRTLEKRVTCTVGSRNSTDDTHRCALAVTVTAGG